jgi:hypothetical protein
MHPAEVDEEHEARDLSPDGSLDSQEPLGLAERVDTIEAIEAIDTIEASLAPRASADGDRSDDVPVEDAVAGDVDAEGLVTEDLAVAEAAQDALTEVSVDDGAVATEQLTDEAERAEEVDEADDDLALDDLVLFFHEDDQDEALEASPDDVALFDDVHPAPSAPPTPTVGARAAATAPVVRIDRSEPRPPGAFRDSIDALCSLTERLSIPTKDRSERLRLVNELSAALARLRR